MVAVRIKTRLLYSISYLQPACLLFLFQVTLINIFKNYIFSISVIEINEFFGGKYETNIFLRCCVAFLELIDDW